MAACLEWHSAEFWGAVFEEAPGCLFAEPGCLFAEEAAAVDAISSLSLGVRIGKFTEIGLPTSGLILSQQIVSFSIVRMWYLGYERSPP